MIVVDTSALIAILLREPSADACEQALMQADRLLISAGTLTETMIVAVRRRAFDKMKLLVDVLDLEVVPIPPLWPTKQPPPMNAGARASTPPA